MTNSGACSWLEFAREIFRQCGVPAAPTPTTSDAYGARARRPPNSVLRNTRALALGLAPLRPWPEALRAYLVAKGHLAR